MPTRSLTPRPVDVEIDGRVQLPGRLRLPDTAAGLVVFAHGSGSSHRSPRNNAVAELLGAAGLATLLFDLLLPDEGEDRANVFDIPLLAERLRAASTWARSQAELGDLALGYFGASTGAAAALWAAADAPADVAAVVSRGGRPDLAGPRLAEVACPTLLVVGAADHGVVELNQQAHAGLHCTRELVLVPGATHLFSEPGALEAAAEHAANWFTRYLGS